MTILGINAFSLLMAIKMPLVRAHIFNYCFGMHFSHCFLVLALFSASTPAATNSRPGSLDAGFATSLPGPVIGVATSPSGLIMVVSTNSTEPYTGGNWFLLNSAGGTLHSNLWPEAFVVTCLSNGTFRVAGRWYFWDTVDQLWTADIDSAGNLSNDRKPGLISWQGPPVVMSLFRSGRLAVGYRNNDDSDHVYVEPNHMWMEIGNDQSILAYYPGATQRIRAFASQPDGSTILGGRFTNVAGINWSHLARLLPNGELDLAFGGVQGSNGTDSAVSAIAALPDGRLIVGGTFQTVFGTPRIRIARLLPNGTVDPSFHPGIGPNDRVQAIASLDDGRVVIAGLFTSVGGIARSRVARLNSDGSVDLTFDPGAGPNTAPTQIALEANGDVLIGGNFTSVDGVARTNLARLRGDGLRFVPPAVLENGTLVLSLNVRPSVRHVLEFSTNLSNWSPFVTNIPVATPWQVEIPEDATRSKYFRALERP